MPEELERFSSCDVCGRTILKGEQIHEYVNPPAEEHGVCVLCRSEAEASGWIPAAEYSAVAQQPTTRRRRGEALRKRLGEAASRTRDALRPRRAPAPEYEEPVVEPEQAPPQATGRGPAEDQPVEAEKPRSRPAKRPTRPQAKRTPKRGPATAAARESAPRPRRGPEAIMRKAVERFNASHETRKVAGLIRSLGEPQAAVRPNAERQLALVTVAWELSWYQWEVGGGSDETVREIAKGDEVSELPQDSRAWNAAVTGDGTLRLRSAKARQQVSAKEA